MGSNLFLMIEMFCYLDILDFSAYNLHLYNIMLV